MAAIVLSTVMDALAAACTDVSVRAYAWPIESPSTPCVIVGYPDPIEFDATFNRGSDRAEFPLYYIVGKVADKQARDALSVVIAGATSFKDAIDGTLGNTVNSASVIDCNIEEISMAGINYLSATFTVEVYS